ncbi:a disintegrin and metalloproteinase with thrombospondin motifs 2 [Paragonimus westermani]|uniref:A disintegrin and metalloproteinase with thrombospondin motifs 2 n=1 Tax=Paragonimus westermani TaxID=34504 RepID=A0A5J4NC97_9TREM|nr:a disintegrin and metalloproteinase with thrombospondin motifs 2 [Paragonimus westermani]
MRHRLMKRGIRISQKFTCLEDYPIDERKFALREPPGRYWNLDEQCHVLTSSNVSRHCPGVEEHTCQELWCSITGSIDQCDRMLNHGLLDGTSCDPGKECHQGSCTLRPVSPSGTRKVFSPWSPCSKVCGLGTQYRTWQFSCSRTMDDQPGTQETKEYRICMRTQTDQCSSLEDFRAQQCSRFDLYKLRGIYHSWLPFVDYENPCQLKCLSRQTGSILDGSIAVRDGTPCYYTNPDPQCVQSQCIHFDCLGVVNGTAKRDQCGVCEGNGENCRLVVNNITRNITDSDGYRIIYLIPYLARELDIRMISNTHLIGLFDMAEMEFLFHVEKNLSGSSVRRVFFHTEFTVQQVEHMGTPRVVSITAPGPVVGDLALRTATAPQDELCTQ